MENLLTDFMVLMVKQLPLYEQLSKVLLSEMPLQDVASELKFLTRIAISTRLLSKVSKTFK